MTSLESLVQSAQRGNLDAFSTIVARFQDMAYALAYAQLGDSHLAEDAAQEAFLEAYLHLNQLQEASAFPGWFRTIVMRRCTRLIRSRKPVVALAATEALASDAPGPDRAVEVQEIQETVHRAIQALPEKQCQVTLLYYLADHSYQEIAELLGVRVSTVKSRLHTARTILRERMLEMVEENLHNMRPSRDEAFAKQVMDFIRAVDAGKISEVEALLAEDASLVDVQGLVPYTSRQRRPLHFAIGYGHQEMVELLLAQGANVNATDDHGWTPLHIAAAKGNRSLAEQLIARGADVDIFAAAALADVEQVKTWLAAHPTQVHQRGPDEATPLHFAATVAVAQALLDRGADLNARDGVYRETPLGWHADKPDLIRFLLAQGARVDDIFLVCAIGQLAHVETLLAQDPALVQARTSESSRHGAHATPLHVAAYYGHLPVAQLLLNQGADVNAVENVGAVTPLHRAVQGGHLEMVRFLIEQGADIDAKDTEFNSTSLGWARFFRQQPIIELLEDITHDSAAQS